MAVTAEGAGAAAGGAATSGGAAMREQNCVFARPAAALAVSERCFEELYAGVVIETAGDDRLLHRLAFLELVESFCCTGARSEGFTVRGVFLVDGIYVRVLPPASASPIRGPPPPGACAAQRKGQKRTVWNVGQTRHRSRAGIPRLKITPFLISRSSLSQPPRDPAVRPILAKDPQSLLETGRD